MCRIRFLLLVAVALVFGGQAIAGFYDPTKPELLVSGEALPLDLFRDRWAEIIRIGMPAPDPKDDPKERKKALADRHALQQLANPSPSDLVRRGILAIQLQDIDAGISDLQQAYRQSRDFWSLTALGTAHQHADQIADAVRHLEAAADLMPNPWTNASQAVAVRRVEAAQLTLARLRLREQSTRQDRSRPPELDNLFGVRFVGPSGNYEAGKIDPIEKAKLPADAIATVQQLLVWLPGDTRLYWYLGELYNAQGDIDSAYAIFDECLNARRLDAPLLREHRRIVRDAITERDEAAAKAAAAEVAAAWNPGQTRWLIAAGVTVPIILVLIYFQFREIGRRVRRRKDAQKS